MKRPELLPNPDVDLADRHPDGMDIVLWWVKNTLRTYVTVNDTKTGHQFMVDTPEGENPMHVFEHPHAFKADEYERIPA